MRLLEIKSLLEASNLSPAELAKRNYEKLGILIAKITDNGTFELVDGSKVKIKPEEAERLQQLADEGTLRGAISVQTNKGLKPLSSFAKTAEFGGTGLTADKVANRGEIAEGILGAAMFAKLSARVSSGIGNVGGPEVWAVIDQLKNTGEDNYSIEVKDKGRTVVNDKIQFTLRLKAAPYRDIMDPKKRPLLNDLLASALAYANSTRAQEYSEYFFMNGKPDIINVVSDGVSGEKTRKTDVEVYVTDPKTGRVDKRKLNISLKAGSDQMGQVGGSEFSKMKELWAKFGILIDSYEAEYNEIYQDQGADAAIEFIYRQADMLLKQLLSGDYDDEEYMYVRKFINGIDYFATLNDPSIELVSFESGHYKVLKFSQLAKKLKQINLDSVYNESTKNPRVDIIDKNSGKIFLTVRHKTENNGKVRRNYIEKGPVLSELASIE
jgi:hypothetical protein